MKPLAETAESAADDVVTRFSAIRLSVRLIAVAFLVIPVGCQSPFYQDQLALFGGLTGAGVGALVGEGHGDALAGAAIGSAVGAASGATVGAALDEVRAHNEQLIEVELGRQLSGATTNEDVVAMVGAGLSDEVIVTHIRTNGVSHPPTAPDLVSLKNRGVNDTILNAMQTAATRDVTVVGVPAPPVVVERHVYGPCLSPLGPPRGCRPPRHHHPRGRMHWGVSFGH